MKQGELYCSNYVSYVVGSIATHLASFGEGTVPIVLSYIRCQGSETRLLDCPANYLLYSSCSHREDAGVRCHQQTGNLYVLLIMSSNYLSNIQIVKMEILDWLEVLTLGKVVLKYATVEYGEQYAISCGMMLMPL